MATTTSAGQRAQRPAPAAKEPGRIRQIWQVLKTTVQHDRPSLWILVGAFVAPLALALILCAIFDGGNPVTWVLASVVGVLAGLLLFMFALNWRAEKVAYRQIEGRPGAAGQVMSSTLRGQWTSSDMPVAFNPKTQDCVYRAVGRPGIVFVTEGGKSTVRRLLDDERRKTQRVAPNVPIHHIHVGTGEGDASLLSLRRRMNKLDGKLTRSEIEAVTNRLASLRTNALPIPKGVDPMRMRPSRKGPR